MTLASKKHWINYVAPSALLFLGVLLFFGSGHFSILKILGVALLFSALSAIAGLRKVKWTLTDDVLHIQRGVLPWRQTDLSIPIYDIYEAYTTRGMFGHFLNFAHIHIRRTEGRTTQFNESRMERAGELSGLINERVRDYKKNKHVTVIHTDTPERNIVSELKTLSDLRRAGDISEQEYERLKNDLINRARS